MKHVKSLTVPSRALNLGGILAGFDLAAWFAFVYATLKDALVTVGGDPGDPEDVL